MMIAGGGSGGHIYPALAIVAAVRARDPKAEVLYVGTSHGLEADLVPRANIPYRTIAARGLLVRGIAGKARGALTAVAGLVDALRLIRRFRPDVVVGTGGYVSGPVGLAAAWLGVPLVIQEQNAWPGLTNRTLAKRAQHVVVPYEEACQFFPKSVPVSVISNPVDLGGVEPREEARKALGMPSECVLLMVTGGSQGAAALNRFVLQHLAEIAANPGWGLAWATGKRYGKEVKREMARLNLAVDPKRVHIVEYFYGIQRVYAAADLFLGRAGAMTLADCQAFALPALLVPSPHVVEDHQTKNARALERLGGAQVLPEDALFAQGWEAVKRLLEDGERRREMGRRARAGFHPDAADRIAAIVMAAARERGRRRGRRREKEE